MDHWDHLLENLDKVLKEIETIDKAHSYKIMSIVVREDPINRGIISENLEAWK